MVLPVVYQIILPVSATDLLIKLGIAGIILLVTWIISKLIGSLISTTLGKLRKNVALQIRRILTWLIWLIGIMISLSQLGLELTVLLVAVTLGGVIIAIAFRHVLTNLVSYEVIKSYNPFKIGDWVKVGKYFGRINDITWLETILTTPDNEIIHIPNSSMTQSIVVNKTCPGGTRISIPIVVDGSVDISEVEKMLLNIGNELKEELICDSEPEVRVTDLGMQSTKLALLLKISNPGKAKLIASKVRKMAKEQLDKTKQQTSNPQP